MSSENDFLRGYVVPKSDTALTMKTQTLTSAAARIVLTAAEHYAFKKKLKLSICVVDAAANLLAFVRMDHASLISVDVSMAKARTAAKLGQPTRLFQDQVDEGRTSLLGVEGLCPVQGGVPIILNGVVVGGIGTSGESSENDELAACAGVEALIEKAVK